MIFNTGDTESTEGRRGRPAKELTAGKRGQAIYGSSRVLGQSQRDSSLALGRTTRRGGRCFAGFEAVGGDGEKRAERNGEFSTAHSQESRC